MDKTLAEQQFEALEARRLAAESSGDNVELGRVLTLLSYHAKNHGVPGGSPFPQAAAYALQAVKVLRKTDERKLLAEALRATDVAFVTRDSGPACLEEALQISREIGDTEGVIRTLHRMAARAAMSGDGEKAQILNEQVERLATDSQNLKEMGKSMMRRGMSMPFGAPDKYALFLEAADVLIRAGAHGEAGFTYVLSSIGAESREVTAARKLLAANQFRLAKDYHKLATTLGGLARLAREDGDLELAKSYRDQAAEFDVILHGSKRARILYHIELAQQCISETEESLESIDDVDEEADTDPDALAAQREEMRRDWTQEIQSSQADLAELEAELAELGSDEN